MIPMIITQASWRRGTPRSGMQVSAGALLSVGLGDRFIGSTPHIFSARFTISTAIRSWRSASWGIPTVDAEVAQVLVDQGAHLLPDTAKSMESSLYRSWISISMTSRR